MTPPSLFLIVVLFIGALFNSDLVMAQEPSTYKMEFVRAGWLKDRTGKKQVVVVFKITPLVDDFMMVMSMQLGYGFNGVIGQTDVGNDKIRFEIFGNNVADKSWKTYQLIKEKIDLSDPNIMLLQMRFLELEEENVEDMSIIYGLWEGENNEVRIEQEFRFHVEDLRNVPYERKE